MVPPPISDKAMWEMYKLSRRYKKNSLKSKRKKGKNLPPGEFWIDQILCDEDDNGSGIFYLIRWEGHELPTWEPVSGIPGRVRRHYYSQGRVTIELYNKLCNHIGIREI